MPALCSMLSGTNYAQNYAGIIGRSLITVQEANNQMFTMLKKGNGRKNPVVGIIKPVLGY